MAFIDFLVPADINLGTMAGLDIRLNGTFDPDSYPNDVEPMIVYGVPNWYNNPFTYGEALPVREWNAWFGAPGYNVAERVTPDRFVNMPYPQVGVNPWDHIFGNIRADDSIQAVRARLLGSQEGMVSFI